MGSKLGPPDATEVTVPTLLRLPPLGLTVAAYTDGFDHYLADNELGEIAEAGRNGFPRLAPRRAGGWQIQADPADRDARPVVLARAVIAGQLHFVTGPDWPWPISAPATGPVGGRSRG